MSIYDDLKGQYKGYLKKKWLFSIIVFTVAFIAMGLELSTGSFKIEFLESFEIVIDHITGNTGTDPTSIRKDFIVWDTRLPRAIAGMLCGVGFAICGAMMQSSLKNPLADPYTTGISAGASLGATLAIGLGICIIPGIYGELATVINAFAFALIPGTAIVLVTIFKKHMSASMMILVGVAVMYLFTAVSTMIRLTLTEDTLADLYIWNVGTIGKASWENLHYMLIAAVLAIIVGMAMYRKLNLLITSDNVARSLGADPKKVRIIMLVTVSLVAALFVSFTGTIGFVGLVAPHVGRLFMGSDNKYLIPASAAIGAMLMLVSDCIAKSVGSGLPVGTITALIGGPLFLYLLVKQSKTYKW